jgi:hypothetical protein
MLISPLKPLVKLIHPDTKFLKIKTHLITLSPEIKRKIEFYF